MHFDITLITGIMLGFEYLPPYESGLDDSHSLIVDILFVRLLFQW